MLDPTTLATIAGILGINACNLWKAYLTYAKSGDEEFEKERLAGRYEQSLSIIRQGLITKVLRNLYPRQALEEACLASVDIVVERYARPTSIVVPARMPRIAVALDNVHDTYKLVAKSAAAATPDADETARLLDRIERRGVKVWNDPIYSLTQADFSENTLRAQFYLDDFYDFRFGIGALEDELIEALIDADLNPESVSLSRLPLRSKYLPSADSVSDLSTRLCVGGVGVVLALAHDGQFVIPLQRRGRNVSDGQGMLSVLPKAFHQPLIDPISEIALSRTIYRELYEELFGGMEAEKTRRRIRFDWYQGRHPALKWLVDHKSAFQLECTCFGYNLTTGDFEYGILLAVPDETYWQEFSCDLVTNWEVLDEGVPLLRTKQANQLATMLKKPEWTGESLFTLVHGLRRLKEIYPDRVTLPEVEIVV